MSENEEKKVETTEEETEETTEAEAPNWEAEAKKWEGLAKRDKKRIDKLEVALKEALNTEKPNVESRAKENFEDGFDLAAKSYLRAEGINRNEFDWVYDQMKDSGKSLDNLMDAKWFQAELKERRANEASKEAIPSGTKRTGGGTRDKVEYWIAKGEMPPPDQVELRREYVKAREKAEERSKFSDMPVL
jgi:hypothetical protein